MLINPEGCPLRTRLQYLHYSLIIAIFAFVTNNSIDIWYGVFLRASLARRVCFIMCISFCLKALRIMVDVLGRLMLAGIAPDSSVGTGSEIIHLFFKMISAEPIRNDAPEVFGRSAPANTPQFSENISPKSNFIHYCPIKFILT